LRVNASRNEKLKFLIDTGAEISIVSSSRLKPGFKYQCNDGINVRGVSNLVLKTEGTTKLKLATTTHETIHTFHIMGSDFQLQYDGILGRDFWEDKEAAINYCNREIIMGNIIIKFDSKGDNENKKSRKCTLKARTENLVELPTSSIGQGLIPKIELLPGVYLAESLSKGINGTA
jgi:hypothetical protein